MQFLTILCVLKAYPPSNWIVSRNLKVPSNTGPMNSITSLGPMVKDFKNLHAVLGLS